MTRARLICIAISACTMVPLPAHGADTITAWEITSNIVVWGKLKAFVCKDALRIDDSLRHYTVTARAPQWKVVYYSDARKLIATRPLAQFDGGLARRLSVIGTAYIGSDDPSKMTGWEKQGTEEYCGHKCFRWAFSKKLREERDMRLWMFLTVADISISRQVSKILAGQFSMPDLGGIIVMHRKGNYKPNIAFETTSIKKLSVPASTFDPPRGYTITTPEKVMFDRQDFEF